MLKLSTVPANVPGDINLELQLKPEKGPFGSQVQDYILANLRLLTKGRPIALPGQAHAALSFVSAVEMLMGLPAAASGFVPQIPVQHLDLGEFRHKFVSHLRDELPGEVSGSGAIFLNGGHSMSPKQVRAAMRLAGLKGAVKYVHFCPGDYRLPAEGGPAQIVDMLLTALQANGITAKDLEQRPILFQPAGNGWTGTLQGVALYGLVGLWFKCVRQVNGPKGMMPVEIIDLVAMRNWGSAQKPATTIMVGLLPLAITCASAKSAGLPGAATILVEQLGGVEATARILLDAGDAVVPFGWIQRPLEGWIEAIK
jgi:hypothetical protein